MMGFYVNLFTVDASFEMGPRWIFLNDGPIVIISHELGLIFDKNTCAWFAMAERQRERETGRDREWQRETERDRETERHRDTETQREAETEREEDRERERGRKSAHRGKIRHGKVSSFF